MGGVIRDDDMDADGLSYGEKREMLRVLLSALKKRLNEEQIAWLCARRERAIFFEAAMGIA